MIQNNCTDVYSKSLLSLLCLPLKVGLLGLVPVLNIKLLLVRAMYAKGTRDNYVFLLIGLQRPQVFLGFFAGCFENSSFLRKSITLAGGDVNLSPLRVDLSRPRLKLLLLDFDLVMEDLSLV